MPILRATVRADAVVDGENSLQVVVFDLARNRAAALLSNHPEFPDSCLPAQFGLVEHVNQVFVDRADVLLKQFRDRQDRERERGGDPERPT